MTRIRLIMLSLLAVFAFGALAAASASAALPEFEGPFPNTFTSKSGAGKLQTVGGQEVTCTADSNTGSITGAKTDTANVTFTGCESVTLKAKCQSGANEGEIKTVELSSTLGYISKAAKTVGIDLKPKAGELFASFECGGVKIEVKGSVIGALTPINTKTKSFKLKFKETAGKQEVTKLEGEPTDVLMTSIAGGAFEESGESTEDTLTTAKATTVKA